MQEPNTKAQQEPTVNENNYYYLLTQKHFNRLL